MQGTLLQPQHGEGISPGKHLSHFPVTLPHNGERTLFLNEKQACFKGIKALSLPLHLDKRLLQPESVLLAGMLQRIIRDPAYGESQYLQAFQIQTHTFPDLRSGKVHGPHDFADLCSFSLIGFCQSQTVQKA